MAKIKPLLPTLREKKRYIVFEIVSKQKIGNEKDIAKVIMQQGTEYLGTLGMAQAGIKILNNKYDNNTQRGIIRVNHKYVDKIKTAMMFITKINNEEIIIKSIGVSGILKKAINKYIIS